MERLLSECEQPYQRLSILRLELPDFFYPS
jgi:hypothetical protein